MPYVNCWHQGIHGTAEGVAGEVHKWQQFAIATLGREQLRRLLFMTPKSPAVDAVRRLVSAVTDLVSQKLRGTIEDVFARANLKLEPCELDVFMQQAGPPKNPSGPNFSVMVARVHNDQMVKDTLQQAGRPIQVAALVTLPRHTIVPAMFKRGSKVGDAVSVTSGPGKTRKAGTVVRVGERTVAAVFEDPGETDVLPTWMHVLGSGAPFEVGPAAGCMGIFLAGLEHESVSVDSTATCMKLAIRYRFGRKEPGAR